MSDKAKTAEEIDGLIGQMQANVEQLQDEITALEQQANRRGDGRRRHLHYCVLRK